MVAAAPLGLAPVASRNSVPKLVNVMPYASVPSGSANSLGCIVPYAETGLLHPEPVRRFQLGGSSLR